MYFFFSGNEHVWLYTPCSAIFTYAFLSLLEAHVIQWASLVFLYSTKDASCGNLQCLGAFVSARLRVEKLDRSKLCRPFRAKVPHAPRLLEREWRAMQKDHSSAGCFPQGGCFAHLLVTQFSVGIRTHMER